MLYRILEMISSVYHSYGDCRVHVCVIVFVWQRTKLLGTVRIWRIWSLVCKFVGQLPYSILQLVNIISASRVVCLGYTHTHTHTLTHTHKHSQKQKKCRVLFKSSLNIMVECSVCIHAHTQSWCCDYCRRNC